MPVRALQGLRVAAALLRVAAALLWLTAIGQPWTSHGVLSHSSVLDAAGLVRRGAVPSVPSSAAWLLVVPALCGALVLALAWWSSWWARTPALLAGLLGAVVVVVLLGELAAWPDRLGPAAWMGIAGIGLLVLGELADLPPRWLSRR